MSSLVIVPLLIIAVALCSWFTYVLLYDPYRNMPETETPPSPRYALLSDLHDILVRLGLGEKAPARMRYATPEGYKPPQDNSEPREETPQDVEFENVTTSTKQRDPDSPQKPATENSEAEDRESEEPPSDTDVGSDPLPMSDETKDVVENADDQGTSDTEGETETKTDTESDDDEEATEEDEETEATEDQEVNEDDDEAEEDDDTGTTKTQKTLEDW